MEQVKVAVVIPFYKENLSHNELVSVQQCFKILGGYPIITVKPNSLSLSEAVTSFPFTDTVNFDDAYFKNIAGYNRLMLSPEFYGAFLNYDYILIHQPDAFVFKDELQHWCNKNFDYVGSPWIRTTHKTNRLNWLASRFRFFVYRYVNRGKTGLSNFADLEYQVGNGGFSLRRVQRFYELCSILKPVIDTYTANNHPLFNEDIFWSVEVKRQGYRFNIPHYKQAIKFGFEIAPERARILNNGALPFGCHAWDINIEYWRPIFKEYGYEVT
ncbi:hypothetical protein DJ568_12095 [Mucilaginibacter hurinus]|uniref:DUF5672 domain-containing protein n=1 Tax=Mucilaginibacter hurinus TaxID=2201324 RepID=A0A367GNF0_9SPHI|nr:DUF5672 family protein [Mucilaginibacter hurinus]RCH54555.1 hypothetical protein DJ568_12095 [Mucilaginibacter hurinus]